MQRNLEGLLWPRAQNALHLSDFSIKLRDLTLRFSKSAFFFFKLNLGTTDFNLNPLDIDCVRFAVTFLFVPIAFQEKELRLNTTPIVGLFGPGVGLVRLARRVWNVYHTMVQLVKDACPVNLSILSPKCKP